MKIGELARQAGCRVVTVRYYEREGLLPPPERSAGNYRLYGPADLERLRFIRHCRQHGMSLGDIRELVSFQERPNGDCGWIHALVNRHMANVEAQIAALQHLKEHLRELLRPCSGGTREPCVILQGLHAWQTCSRCPQELAQSCPAAQSDGKDEPIPRS